MYPSGSFVGKASIHFPMCLGLPQLSTRAKTRGGCNLRSESQQIEMKDRHLPVFSTLNPKPTQGMENHRKPHG